MTHHWLKFVCANDTEETETGMSVPRHLFVHCAVGTPEVQAAIRAIADALQVHMCAEQSLVLRSTMISDD